MRSLLILAAGTGAAVAAGAVEDPEDQQAFLAGSVLDPPGDVGNAVGNPFVLTGLAAGTWLIGRAASEDSFRRAGYDGAEALLASGGIALVLKQAVDRTRPDGSRYSFPSGHATGTFALAPVLAHHFGWKGGVAGYGLSAAASIGRLKDRRHFLSDVVAGAALGTMVGTAVVAQRRSGTVLEHVAFAPGGVCFHLEF